MIGVSVQEEPFAPAELMAELVEAAAERNLGGIANFVGLVRRDGDLERLELEQFPGMTEKALNGLANEASERWPLGIVRIVHRHGSMKPGEPIVFVGVAAGHRTEALEGCAFLIDRLKTDAPFWKKEWRRDGSTRWVEAKAEDDARAEEWRAK